MTKIDTKDRQILRALEQNGRISNLDLAEKVALSPSACLRRVAALEAADVITGYRAILNPAQMGVGFLAYITVGLSEHTKRSQERSRPRLRARRKFVNATILPAQSNTCCGSRRKVWRPTRDSTPRSSAHFRKLPRSKHML
jgi:DNA-binding Lrp family transcriptional regulator